MIKSITRSVFVVFLMLFSYAALADQVTLGTATKGGGFELFGRTVSEVVNASDSAAKFKTVATKGSRQNLKLLLSGDVDAALVEGNAAHAAFKGKDAQDKLRVLWVMYPSPGAFVVRADTSYKTIADLKGKTIAWGTSASGLRLLAKSIVEGLELDTDKDFKPVILKRAGDGPGLVLDGKVDGLWGGGIGWPTFRKIANGPKGARFIYPSEDEVAKILKTQPHLLKMTIPAHTYKGQDKPINSVGLWSLVLIRKDVPEAKVYALAQALAKSKDELAKALPQTTFTTAENTAKNVAQDRIHAGVVKFLKEQKLLGE